MNWNEFMKERERWIKVVKVTKPTGYGYSICIEIDGNYAEENTAKRMQEYFAEIVQEIEA